MIPHMMHTTKNITRVGLVQSAFMGSYRAPYISPPVVGGEDTHDDTEKNGNSEGENDIDGNSDGQAFGTEVEGHEDSILASWTLPLRANVLGLQQDQEAQGNHK